MARAATTSDVFNAVADGCRRAILDALLGGERAVGDLVEELGMSQPQVSKHLRVLSDVGLVNRRAEGRHRLYRLKPENLRPLADWLSSYEAVIHERLDRMEDYLTRLQGEVEGNGT